MAEANWTTTCVECVKAHKNLWLTSQVRCFQKERMCGKHRTQNDIGLWTNQKSAVLYPSSESGCLQDQSKELFKILHLYVGAANQNTLFSVLHLHLVRNQASLYIFISTL